MTTPSDLELDLDLQLLPAWAREPSSTNRYAKFEGETDTERRGRPGERWNRAADRLPRYRDRPPGDRGRRPDTGRTRPGEGRGRPGPGPGRGEREAEPQEPPIPLPEVNVDFFPEEKGVDSLARQIKLRGRAYPLFGVATLVLKAPERYQVQFSVCRGADGTPVQPLIVCTLDESLWLTLDEVVDHALRHHFATFYQTEKVPTEPPKGTYTFVAQCGMSGLILGPPNYHDYQTKLRRLHAERFSRMPFEVFKSRVKIVRDEAVVKRWVEEQSSRQEYVCLNVPETIKFNTREEVEQHFRTVHLPNLTRSVETFLLPIGGKRPPMAYALSLLLRRAVEDQRRFPLKLATVLSQQFAGRGLQFFKVNRTVTHVCVARPHYLDTENIVVSEGVRRIVEFINRHPGCNRRRLLDALAPTPAAAPLPARPTAPPADAQPAAATGEPAPAGPAPAPAATEPEASQPTPEQTAVITDLHWLVHQGHVIEFSDGHLETAKAPKPRPPAPARPEPSAPPPPAPAPSPAPEAAATAATDGSGASTAAAVDSVAAPRPPAAAAVPEAVPAEATGTSVPEPLPEPATPAEETIEPLVPRAEEPVSASASPEAATP